MDWDLYHSDTETLRRPVRRRVENTPARFILEEVAACHAFASAAVN
jgi:hypothetical protein